LRESGACCAPYSPFFRPLLKKKGEVKKEKELNKLKAKKMTAKNKKKFTSEVLIALTILFLCFLKIPQVFASEGTIVVSEFMANPKAVNDSKGEWFELYNKGPEDINLKDWTIETRSGQHLFSQDVLMEAGGFVVVCKNSNFEENGGIPCSYQYTGLNLANSGGEIKLNSGDFSAFILEYSAEMVEEGKSTELTNVEEAVLENISSPENWQFCTNEMESHDFGTPEAANSSQQESIEEFIENDKEDDSEKDSEKDNDSETNNPPSSTLNDSAKIFLTKIIPNPKGLDKEDNEFIEIYNPNDFSVDLLEWKLSNRNGQEYTFKESFILDPLEYKTIYRQIFNFNLYNQDGSVSLFNKKGDLVDNLSFNGTAGEEKIFNKKPGGEVFWSSSDSTPLNNTENENTNVLKTEENSSQNSPLKINEISQLIFLNNLTEVFLEGIVVSPIGIPQQNSFYLQKNEQGILIKLSGGKKYELGDYLKIKSGVLHQTQSYNYLKISGLENIEKKQNKDIEYFNIEKCLKEENCLKNIGSAVKFRGNFSKKTSTALFFKNEDFEIELYLPNNLYFNTSTLKEGDLYEIKGVLEKPNANFRILATSKKSLSLIKKNVTEDNIPEDKKVKTNLTTVKSDKNIIIKKGVEDNFSPLIKKPLFFQDKIKIIENIAKNEGEKNQQGDKKDTLHFLLIKVLKTLASII
jgi:hypothetical protein